MRADVYPDKARFVPSEPVNLVVELNGKPEETLKVSATVWRLGTATTSMDPQTVGTKIEPITIRRPSGNYIVRVALVIVRGALLIASITKICAKASGRRMVKKLVPVAALGKNSLLCAR